MNPLSICYHNVQVIKRAYMPAETMHFLKILMLITHVSNFVRNLYESCSRRDFLSQSFDVMRHIVHRLFDAYNFFQ